MMRRIVLFLSVVSAVMLWSGYCDAKGEGPAGQEEWNPPSAGPITTWAAPLCGRGKLAVQPFFFYNAVRGTFDSSGHYNSLPGDDKKYQFQEQILMQYGITGRLELDAQTVYQQNYAKEGGNKAHTSGFGDSFLFLRYCAWGKDGLNVTAMAQLKMPTGKYEHADTDKLGTDIMGTGSWDPGAGVIITKRLKPFIFHADAIYGFPQEFRVDGAKTRYANYLNYDASVEYFLPRGFNLMFEVNGFLQGDMHSGGRRVPSSAARYVTIAPGIGWANDEVQILAAYQRLVAGEGDIDATDSVVLTFIYTF